MKKRVLYLIAALALVLGLVLPMATPVLAAQISGTKQTVPLLPNIYYIGDTIDYVMTVSNPGANTRTNTLTRIWDTLPDGTVIEFLAPVDTLVQAPGETATFYASYTVDASHLIWLSGPGYWAVRNTFEAEGYDSAGDGVYVFVTRNSRIIQPDTEVGIDASATSVAPGGSVGLTITEANTGDAELTNPYVEVWKDGGLLATLTQPPDSGDLNGDEILDPGETWSWTISSGPISDDTTFVALGFGTDPLGNEVSYAEGYLAERDEVTVTVTVSAPSIDVEKYVWDGGAWHDADTTTGPYLPSTQNPVIFKFEIDNDGNVDLTGVSLTDTDMTTFYTNQACTVVATFPIATLAPGDPLVTVYGKLPWATGQHSNTATVTGTPPTGPAVSDSDPAHYFGSAPSIDVEKYVWDGGAWHDADTTTGPYLPSTQNPVIFKFEIDNDGNVDLTGVSLTDTDMTTFYTNQACTVVATFPIATLAPGDPLVTVYGKLTWAAGQHSNTATATGTPPTGPAVSDSDPAHYFGSVVPSIDVEKYVWDGGAWRDADHTTGPYLPSTQDPVIFKFVIDNDGSVDLSGVSLTDTDMTTFYTNQACTIAATFPVSLAAGAPSVTVYSKLTWAAGQHSNTATATGTPPTGPAVSDSDPAHYFGSEPHTVGWETYPINKVAVLAPWVAFAAAVVAGATVFVRRRRRVGH